MFLTLSACHATAGEAASAEIPFRFCDGFIWIEVAATGSNERLNFLLDSGAQVSVVNTAAAHRLNLRRGRPVTVMGVCATTTGFWPQTLDARAGSVQLPHRYLMLDLSALAEACTDTRLDGIIGADFFRDRIVQIDYRKRVVRLLRAVSAGSDAQTLPLKMSPGGMLVPVRINDSTPEWVRLDTGCASALQWVAGNVPPETRTTRIAVALAPFTIPVTRTSLSIGDARFEGVPTDLQEKEIFPGEKGLLGNGLLSRFQTVTINAKGREVVLGPVSRSE